MKNINYAALLILGLTSACHSSSDKKNTRNNPDSTVAGNINGPLDSDKLIIAGKQAGKIYLGQDMQNVFKILGKPDDGDAAMGSAIDIWYTKNARDNKKDPVSIFSSYRDSNMVVKAVKQVSVTAPLFETTEGLHAGVKLAKLIAVYPSLKKTAVYVNEKKDSLIVYDSVTAGIAFDIEQDSCTAITVHPKNKSVNAVTCLCIRAGRKYSSKKSVL